MRKRRWVGYTGFMFKRFLTLACAEVEKAAAARQASTARKSLAGKWSFMGNGNMSELGVSALAP